MNLAIDFVGTCKESGTKTYNLNFLQKLKYFQSNNIIHIFLTKNYERELKLKANKNIKLIILPNYFSITLIRILWMQIILPFHLLFLNVDTLFSPMNIAPIILRYIGIKSFLGLHTNLPWININLLPGSYLRNFLMKKLIEISIINSKKVITCSNYSKNQLSKSLKLNKNKIITIYLGISKSFSKYRKIRLKNKYILSIMSCTKYHGIIEIMKSFKIFKKNKKTKVQLVLIMSILDKEYYKKILKYIDENFKKGDINIIKKINHRYLDYVYKKSSLYIFSSLSEVFGFTTLEALKNNKRVICSNTSALKEINKNYAVYYKFGDYKDLSKKIQKNYNKMPLKNNYLLLRKYDWDLTVNKTLKYIFNN